jgi:uncharacterized membrane protein YdjX (TVP38/TMEM64 family)
MSAHTTIHWQIWIWPVLLLGLAVGAWWLPWDDWVPAMRDWVQARGTFSSVAFVGLYIVVVMLPLPAAAMSVLGGLVFGWWGYPLSLLGSLLGAIPPYLIGRTWLRGLLLRRFPGPKVAAADRAITRNAIPFMLMLRITPVVPFTVQNWMLGLTNIRFWPYCWTTVVGLAPGTLAMVWVGEVGGLVTSEAGWTRTLLVAGGLLGFGAMMLWLTRVATRELRAAGFDPAPNDDADDLTTGRRGPMP